MNTNSTIEGEKILQNWAASFDHLPLHASGYSRVIRTLPEQPFFICQLLDTVFSLEQGGPVPAPGIATARAALSQFFSSKLEEAGIACAVCASLGSLLFLRPSQCAPLEVVVKAALVGTPKHQYHGILQTPTRSGPPLTCGTTYPPYVRFDWRNPLPYADACMPQGLADYFIDTKTASTIAIAAFKLIREILVEQEFGLLDICFFLSPDGLTICGEISTDNTRIIYNGANRNLQKLFSSRRIEDSVERGWALLKSLSADAEI